MKRTLRTFLCLPILMGLGCATVDRYDPTSDGDVAELREEREAEMVENFEASRTEAQLLAAMSSWEHGDPASARQSVEAVLARDPEHRAARLLLADMLAEQGEFQAAENQLRGLVAHDDADAQAHFALGLVLESGGKYAESLTHLERALQLDPQNELFAVAVEALSEQASAGTAIASEAPFTGDAYLQPVSR